MRSRLVGTVSTATIEPAAIDFTRPGKHHYKAAFHLDGSWGYSLVPITVINGLRPSANAPTGVAVFGGTHGNEYEGQITVKRLCHDLDPAEMSGRVILMPQLSERACHAHTRSAPDDGVNMNRAFPGDARGTLSKRIAHFVKQRVFPHAGIVLDLHAGGREASFPICTSLHPIADAGKQAAAVAVASLFDTPFVYLYARSMASGLLTDEAEDEGRVAIGGEFGFGEGASVRGIAHAYEGVKNVLRHVGVLTGDVTRVDPARPTPPRVVQAPDLVDYVPCPADGIWEPLVVPGQDVVAGELLGRLHQFEDHASDPLPIVAHRSGVIIALHFGAAAKRGVTLHVIAQDVVTRA
ncbi:MAG TPA: succinylglutamate desuccinylase/aspartoacylase family protein [Luteitalea sp.]|nr:succinylglutamate desuccinylase/aspartoacylase family protein [Luteitalea sp.]